MPEGNLSTGKSAMSQYISAYPSFVSGWCPVELDELLLEEHWRAKIQTLRCHQDLFFSGMLWTRTTGVELSQMSCPGAGLVALSWVLLLFSLG